jgi:hypothetical protein
MRLGEQRDIEIYQLISGILFGFIAIPVFSLLLPLRLANKWRLNYSLWPRSKNAGYVILFCTAYIILTNYSAIQNLFSESYALTDYLVHFISAMLFHVTYYPLFVILLFPLFRERLGLIPAIAITSLLFSLYHLTQFHFFPAGTGLRMQIVLFIAFTFNILIYLWSESIILVSLLHSTNGAVGLLSNGTIFNEVDFLFYLTLIIITGLFIYYIVRDKKLRREYEFEADWWLSVKAGVG